MLLHEKMAKDRIANDLKDHIVIERHRVGLYRHYRCQNPTTWNMGFDIVTWPGSLCYTGDMGEFLFQRTDDMVSFMRSACMDYSYAAEKCVARGSEIKEWSEQRFRQVLEERMADGKTFTAWISNVRSGERRVEDAVNQILWTYDEYSTPHDATRAMCESGLWDGADLPSCDVYTFRFLWCLHAIKWFCGKCD